MVTNIKAIEVTGTIDEHHQLHLDEALTTSKPGRVRVIILISDDANADEHEWLHAAAMNPAL